MVFVIHWRDSAMDLHVFSIPIPPPTSLSTRFLWVFPAHQAQALVSCIQLGLVICFTPDNIHASMLFSRNIPPSPPPTESKNPFVCAYLCKYHLNCGRLHGRRLELPVLAKQVRTPRRGRAWGRACLSYPLDQRSSTFLASGTDFMTDTSTDLGWGLVWGWFKYITFIVHFVYNLTPPLIWQEVLVHSPEAGDPCISPEVGDPCIRYPTKDVE